MQMASISVASLCFTINFKPKISKFMTHWNWASLQAGHVKFCRHGWSVCVECEPFESGSNFYWVKLECYCPIATTFCDLVKLFYWYPYKKCIHIHFTVSFLSARVERFWQFWQHVHRGKTYPESHTPECPRYHSPGRIRWLLLRQCRLQAGQIENNCPQLTIVDDWWFYLFKSR